MKLWLVLAFVFSGPLLILGEYARIREKPDPNILIPPIVLNGVIVAFAMIIFLNHGGISWVMTAVSAVISSIESLIFYYGRRKELPFVGVLGIFMLGFLAIALFLSSAN